MVNDPQDLDHVRARAFDLTADPATVFAPAEERIVDVNDAFLRVSGYDRDEIVGKRPADLELWNRDLIQWILDELRRGGQVTGVAVELRAKDGTLRVLRGAAELVEADGTEYVLAMGEDVSDDLARTDELRRARRSVHALAEDRRRLSARLDLAVGEERARIADALHESTLQALTVATIRLYLLHESLPATHRPEAERVGEAIQTATTSTSALIADLHRPVQERTGLIASIELAMGELATRTTVTREVRGELPRPVPSDVATVAYRMVREIFAFLERNVDASRIEVEVAERDGGLSITIVDDAVSEPTTSDAWRPIVLDPIRERLSAIGGRLAVSTVSDEGNSVELWIPMAGTTGSPTRRSET